MAVSTRTIVNSVLLAGVALLLSSNDKVGVVVAFSTSSSSAVRAVGTRKTVVSRLPVAAALSTKKPEHDQSSNEAPLPRSELTESFSESIRAGKQKALAAGLAIVMATAATTTTTLVPPANAYVPSDYASETVQQSIKDLKSAAGNAGETFKIYESIASIITEGRGVGGQINYKGVELERGFVADEDTTIYNPGLSLLTESEKERLVEGVIDCRKAGLKADQWSEENEYAYEFLRGKLDPYHMVELSGFLSIVPYYGAAIYVAVLAVQQLFRGAFQVAYLVGVAAFFAPIIGLVLAGP